MTSVPSGSRPAPDTGEAGGVQAARARCDVATELEQEVAQHDGYRDLDKGPMVGDDAVSAATHLLRKQRAAQVGNQVRAIGMALAEAELRGDNAVQAAEANHLGKVEWYHRATKAERKVRAVELVHVWTNEDGKRFMFADDVAVALELPGSAQ